MNTKTILRELGSFLLVLLLLAGSMGCGDGKAGSGATSSDSNSHLNAPTPDNNSYTNPSSADTNYQKNNTRKPADSSRGRVSDSLHE